MRPRSIPGVVGFCVLFAGLAGTGPAGGGEARFFSAGIAFSVPVTSVKEARFKTVIKQRFDYSCGSAAVATLLTYHYDRPTTEIDVFKAMWEKGDQAKIRKQGFSLLDMKNYLEELGYTADGYRISTDKVAQAGVPAILVVNIKGYKHFVLIKGIRGDEIVVGDPALGVKIYSRANFEKIRASDVIFLIRTQQEVAREHFNAKRDWGVRGKTPFGTALSRQALGMFFLTLPGQNEF